MATKQYKYEISVSRGWGGVENIQIATGTDDTAELKQLVNSMAEAMQDRADRHQAELRRVEEITRKGIEAAQAAQAENADNEKGN